MKRFLIGSAKFTIVFALGVWSVLVLLFSPALQEQFRLPAASAAGLVFLLNLIGWPKLRAIRVAALAVIATVGGLWLSIPPSNDKVWQDDVSKAPWGEVNGDTVTIHNVRNFKYRSETDYDVIYEDRTVQLSELSEVDILVTYWAGKAIAHIMVSFGFNNQDFIAFSIETRKEKGESYSAVNGFFRNYELAYVAADERDVITLRTNYRNPEERVHVLRTRIALDNGKLLFLDYVKKMNYLRDHPRFYNTLTTNCTTQVLDHVHSFGSSAAYNWQILLSGYVPEYLYENDVLMPGLSLDEIMRQSLVNDKAHQFAGDPSFSAKIREGVPHPAPRTISR